MRIFNLIVVFNEDLTKTLFCIRAKEPYRGLYNFVGGKVEDNETNDEAAYRELFEETGISNKDIELDHFMDLNYFKYENNLQVYYGILKHEVTLVEEKNKLEWVTINDELLDNSKFAGNYNIPHIIRQIKVYLNNGTGIDKYQKVRGVVMKIVTLCGSLKFQKEMMTVAEKMALEGQCILTPVYPVSKNIERTKEQLIKLKEAHFKRIELSDTILVVNINNYIGESTNLEIDYAKKLGKEIIYYTDLIENKQSDNLQFYSY